MSAFDLIPPKPNVGVTSSVANPVIGPASAKIQSIADVQVTQMIQLIELAGVRVAWARATRCPCTANLETSQSDPNCALCTGSGFMYFGPRDYAPPANVGELTPLQKILLADDGAAVIRGLVQTGSVSPAPYETLGDWRNGGLSISVRAENPLGYYDRLTILDTTSPFFEVVETTGAQTLRLRFRATQFNFVSSVDRRYGDGEVEITPEGLLRFIVEPPAAGTRLTVHYQHHPVYRVVEMPHAIRATNQKAKQPTKTTPVGNPQPLAIRAAIDLEELPKAPTPAPGGGG